MLSTCLDCLAIIWHRHVWALPLALVLRPIGPDFAFLRNSTSPKGEVVVVILVVGRIARLPVLNASAVGVYDIDTYSSELIAVGVLSALLFCLTAR